MRCLILLVLLLLATPAWAQMSGSSPPFTGPFGLGLPGGRVAGKYYGPAQAASLASVAISAAGTLYAVPFFVPQPAVAKTMSFDISSGNTSAWNARMCIFADTGTGSPGALVADSGTVAIASGSVTGVQTATLSPSVSLGGPAWYWLAFMVSETGESLESNSSSANALFTSTLIGSPNTANAFGLNVNALSMSQTFGACPANFSASPSIFGASGAPYILVGF